MHNRSQASGYHAHLASTGQSPFTEGGLTAARAKVNLTAPLTTMHPEPGRTRRTFRVLVAVTAAIVATGCLSIKGADPDEKRGFVLGASAEMLVDLYDTNPELQAEVESAPGYAVINYRLSKLPMILTGIGGGSGYGVVIDNETGQQTFLKVTIGEWGAGLGTRVYGTLFIFENRETLDSFKTKGWRSEGGADVAAKTGDSGVAIGAAVASKEGMKVVTVTQSGAAYAVTYRGFRFTPISKLD